MGQPGNRSVGRPLCAAGRGRDVLRPEVSVSAGLKVLASAFRKTHRGGYSLFSASTNRGTCLSSKRQWINCSKDMISVFGQTLEV